MSLSPMTRWGFHNQRKKEQKKSPVDCKLDMSDLSKSEPACQVWLKLNISGFQEKAKLRVWCERNWVFFRDLWPSLSRPSTSFHCFPDHFPVHSTMARLGFSCSSRSTSIPAAAIWYKFRGTAAQCCHGLYRGHRHLLACPWDSWFHVLTVICLLLGPRFSLSKRILVANHVQI